VSAAEIAKQLEGMESEDLRQLLRKVTWACLFAGLSGEEVLDNVSEKIAQHSVSSQKEVCDECGAEVPDDADSLFGDFHAGHCSLNPKNTV
jgi:hypothetical protein